MFTADAEDKIPLTLEGCYALAQKQSEAVAISAEQAKIAQGKYDEAFAALLPNIRTGASQRFRNDPSFGRNNVANNDIATGGSSRALSKHPFEATVTVSQPVFSGFREYFTSRAGKAELEAAKLDAKRKEELLYQDVANIFYQTLYYQEDSNILDSSDKILSERIEELKKFINLGKSRESEIQAAIADQASLGASKAQTEGLFNASKEMLAFLIGKDSSTFSLRKDLAPTTISPIGPLITQGKTRADVEASVKRTEGASHAVTATERSRWPALTANGTYYTFENPELNRDWEVLFRLDVPIFEGGAIDARIDQSRAQMRAATLLANQTRRAAERDIKIAYGNVVSSQREVKTLQTLVSAAQKNYEAQHLDYSRGVVTNVDVLTALKTLQDSKRRLIAAQSDLQTNIVKLNVAAGVVP